MEYPKKVLNHIGAELVPSASGEFYRKLSPHSGEALFEVARSNANDIATAVAAAEKAFPLWSAVPAVKRGEILFDIAYKMKARTREIAEIVALETGKSVKDAIGETGAAISQCLFWAGEGQRYFGRTTVSGVPNRLPMVVREPVGVCGLIIAANTPIANVAWKVFPALVAGNAAILKASEDTPLTAWIVGQIINETEIPKGTLNIVQGLGAEAGAALVANPKVKLVSFTGSTNVGREIAKTAGDRLAKVFLELGGKNALVVCDDADIENALKWVLLSSFSNAGQRCAASSRILVFDSIYEDFKKRLVEKAAQLKVGPTDDDDFGPVINQRQLDNMTAAVDRAKAAGAKVLFGGGRLTTPQHAKGFYMAPTIVEAAKPTDEISRKELFGPITCLYRVKDLEEAITLANDSDFGLTACIHTKNYHRAWEFSRRVQSGVASINAGTHGSEPHMPFGGVKNSGTGGREPGPEALDVYTNVKVIYHNVDPKQI